LFYNLGEGRMPNPEKPYLRLRPIMSSSHLEFIRTKLRNGLPLGDCNCMISAPEERRPPNKPGTGTIREAATAFLSKLICTFAYAAGGAATSCAGINRTPAHSQCAVAART
jgi:hypothetical protein